MSVSLKAEQERAGITEGLGSIMWRKHRNQNNPTRLTDLPKYLMGFQKMNTVDTTGTIYPFKRNQMAVNTEKMNKPQVITDWGGDNLGPTNGRTDPFGEMLSSRQKGFSATNVGMNANMYGVRVNPNANEKIRVSFKTDSLNYPPVNGFTRYSAVVVVLYENWEKSGSGTVLLSFSNTAGWSDFDEEIDLPANGHEIVQVSIQHTIPPQGGDFTYGMGIFDWSCEYI